MISITVGFALFQISNQTNTQNVNIWTTQIMTAHSKLCISPKLYVVKKLVQIELKWQLYSAGIKEQCGELRSCKGCTLHVLDYRKVAGDLIMVMGRIIWTVIGYKPL